MIKRIMISWFERHSKTSWIITFLIALTIFYVSSLTAEETAGAASHGANAIAYHTIIFFVLAFFLLMSVVRGKNQKLIFHALIISVLYGLLDELHQYFVPGRSSAFSDVLLDSIGIFSAFIIYFISLKYRSVNKI